MCILVAGFINFKQGMSTIRKQSILSSIVIYIGFAIGLLNTYIFGREEYFTTEQYGLYSLFNALAVLFSSLAAFAMPAFIYKFFHYYKDNLPHRKNDMVSWALLISTIGFLLVLAASLVFENLIVRKYSENSALFVQYYYWLFPLSFGLTIYTVLEAFALGLRKPVLMSFFKEVEWRLFTTVLLILFMAGVVKDFDLFIKIYAFSYPAIALSILIYLLATKQITFTFSVSKVTRRFFKKIAIFSFFVYSSTIIFSVAAVFDTLVVASVLDDGLAKAGILGLATILTSVIQAPQRGVINASISSLSRAWKAKDLRSLQHIYERSSINLLIFSVVIFVLLALNYTEAIDTMKLKPEFKIGFYAFIFMGLTRIVDMGSGVNAQIIATSIYWRFELITGFILMACMLPLNYFLTIRFDITGPGIANLISFTIYNGVRIWFLWHKFKLQPFSKNSLYTLFVGAIVYAICHFAFAGIHGFPGLIIRSIVAVVLFVICIWRFNLSPDVRPVLQTLLNRVQQMRK